MSKPVLIVGGRDMRSAEEKQQDEAEEAARDAHDVGYCDPDYCFWCIDARERAAESLGG